MNLTYFSILPEDVLVELLVLLPYEQYCPEFIKEQLSSDFNWSRLIFKRYPYSNKGILNYTEETYKELLFIDTYLDNHIIDIIKLDICKNFMIKYYNKEYLLSKEKTINCENINNLIQSLVYISLKKRYKHLFDKFDKNGTVETDFVSLHNYLVYMNTNILKINIPILKYLNTGILPIEYKYNFDDFLNIFGNILYHTSMAEISRKYTISFLETISCIMTEETFQYSNIKQIVDTIKMINPLITNHKLNYSLLDNIEKYRPDIFAKIEILKYL